MNSSRETIPANTLVWVPFGEHLFHPVPAFRLLNSRALFHPLTYPEVREDGGMRAARSVMTVWLVQDVYLGVLPVVGLDQHAARAIAENWTSLTRVGRHAIADAVQNWTSGKPPQRFDPQVDEQVLDWARAYVGEFSDSRARLIDTVPWPDTLPRTRFHGPL